MFADQGKRTMDACGMLYEMKSKQELGEEGRWCYRTILIIRKEDKFKKKNSEDTEPSNKMANTWGYTKEDGPHTWSVSYPQAAGSLQSPVNIETTDAIFDSDLSSSPIQISYKTETGVDMCNTGASFKVNVTQNSEIQGGPLNQKYRLEQFHLHWGSQDAQGSEHTIDNQAFAAELHLVHWNCGKYSSFQEAVDKDDGLAVFGIMIMPGRENTGFKMFTDSMYSVKNKSQTCQIATTFDPSSLLPEDKTKYWTYHGSLTTPPCCESVQWIVFSDPVQYSPKQLDALRSLLDKETGGKCIMDNYRPPLPLGDRKIRSSFPYRL